MDLLSLKWSNHMPSIYKSLALLRTEDSSSDVSLLCNGKFYNVNRLVLSSCSEYFKEIFDRTPSKNVVIIINDTLNSHLELLLDYMYLGEMNVRQTELSELMKVAEYLRIKGLAVPDNSNSETKRTKRSLIGSPMPKNKKRKSIFITEKPHIKDTPTIDNEFSESAEKNDSEFGKASEAKDNISLLHEKDIPVQTKMEEFIKTEVEDDDCSILSERGADHTSDREATNLFDMAEFSGRDDYQYKETDEHHLPITDPPEPEMDSTSAESFSEMDYSHSSNKINRLNVECAKVTNENQCLYCGRVFSAKANRIRHERIHTGEKPFICAFCPHRTAQRQDIGSHIIAKHFNMIESNANVNKYIINFPMEKDK